MTFGANTSEQEREKLFIELNRLSKQFEEPLIFDKLIHQIGPEDKTIWSQAWIICENTWRKNFFDYKYTFWNDKTLDDFVKNHYPVFYEYLYARFPYDIQRYDLGRYFILYHYGGIYADLDYFCVKNFSNLINFNNVNIAESEAKREKYQNALMISPPKHIFWLELIEEIVINSDMDPNLSPHPEDFKSKEIFYVINTTGPKMLEKVIDKTIVDGCRKKYDINILPKNIFTLKSIKSLAFHVSTSCWVNVDAFLEEGVDSGNKDIRKDIIKDWERRRTGIFEDKDQSKYLI